jgi:hypothetical protein
MSPPWTAPRASLPFPLAFSAFGMCRGSWLPREVTHVSQGFLRNAETLCQSGFQRFRGRPEIIQKFTMKMFGQSI